MDYNQDKVDDMLLALLYLTGSTDQYGTRTWKGLNIDILNRLHAKVYISDPNEKSPTMTLSEEGARRSKELFENYFGK